MKKVLIFILAVFSCISCYGLSAINKNIDISYIGMKEEGTKVIFDFSCINNTNENLVLMISTGSYYVNQEENILFLMPDSHFLKSKWVSAGFIEFATQLEIGSHETKRFSIKVPYVDFNKIEILVVTFLFLNEKIKLPIKDSYYERLVQNKGMIFTKSFVVK